MTEEAVGGRIFFSNVRRSLEEEDEIRLVSVGVDIGSSTSHLVFSRLVLERLDNRYIVSSREIVHESDVLLTPYADDMTIDATALGKFINKQYEIAQLDPAAIDGNDIGEGAADFDADPHDVSPSLVRIKSSNARHR